jgi:hypothetical protein
MDHMRTAGSWTLFRWGDKLIVYLRYVGYGREVGADPTEGAADRLGALNSCLSAVLRLCSAETQFRTLIYFRALICYQGRRRFCRTSDRRRLLLLDLEIFRRHWWSQVFAELLQTCLEVIQDYYISKGFENECKFPIRIYATRWSVELNG